MKFLVFNHEKWVYLFLIWLSLSPFVRVCPHLVEPLLLSPPGAFNYFLTCYTSEHLTDNYFDFFQKELSEIILKKFLKFSGNLKLETEFYHGFPSI